MKPRRPISAMSSRGIFLFSSIPAAFGSTFSRAKSRAVRCTSSCSSLRVRSNPDVSVVVVVTMGVLQRVDADVAAVRILRVEEVAVELADGGTHPLRLLVSAAHVGGTEPDHEAGLRAHLRRRLLIGGVVDHDLRVRGVEPDGVTPIFTGEAKDVLIELRRSGALPAEHHHRPDLRLVLVTHVYTYTPRPLFRPRWPAST